MKRFNDSSTSSELPQLEQQLQTLRREVRRLQLEQELLKKANELLKKNQGIILHLLSNREQTLLVDALRHVYSLAELLASLVLARSTYFYHRARSNAGEKYVAVRRTITDTFERNHSAMAAVASRPHWSGNACGSRRRWFGA
ncbi:integrase catalytic region [Comamonas testosteroni KF-1]|uniref:Integrase catalytic region n=1 Tax=Comamonas testosteroni (strain DSM 14576 / KF-1) TaxID=399795 RepID=B7WQW1_COMTK|nr:integrase catalytic region [Comamonas testosteroni KF-1]